MNTRPGPLIRNSDHAHSAGGAPAVPRRTVQVTSVVWQPEIRSPGADQLIPPWTATRPAIRPSSGIAVTVNVSPARTIWDGEAAMPPQRG